jgi:hypothetical protein
MIGMMVSLEGTVAEGNPTITVSSVLEKSNRMPQQAEVPGIHP